MRDGCLACLVRSTIPVGGEAARGAMGSVVVVEVLEAVDEQIVRNANQDAWSLILNEVAQPWKRLRRDSIHTAQPNF